MLIHVPGVGEKTEHKLWNRGINTWDDLLGADYLQGFSETKLKKLKEHVLESRNGLVARDEYYFSERVKSTDQWRAFKEFRDSCAYLDIETTGPSVHSDVTTIAIYDGKEQFTFVNGINLKDFKATIGRYKCIVTYFGRCFDIPVLQRRLKVDFPQIHIDLCFVLRSLGITGGLKAAERHFGIRRGKHECQDGFEAVLLWNKYKRRNDAKALEKLLEYNLKDVINLEPLMVKAYNLKIKELGLELDPLY